MAKQTLAVRVKKCTDCEAVKDITEFNARALSADGIDTRCKRCRATYNRGKKAGRAQVIAEVIELLRGMR